MKVSLFGGKKIEGPRKIDEIVESFNAQVIELDERIALDTDQINIKKVEANKLLNEACNLEKDVERSTRIKDKILNIIA